MTKKKKAGTANKGKGKKGGNVTVVGAGRPTRFRLDLLPKISRMARAGLTDQEIAEILDIQKSTFNNWKARYPKLLEALKGWKEIADDRVVRSLYERAVGYDAPEDKIFHENGNVVIVRTIKHYPPDVAAAFIWLKNRQPDKWKDRKDEGPPASAEEMAREIRAAVQDIDDGIPLALPPNGGSKN